MYVHDGGDNKNSNSDNHDTDNNDDNGISDNNINNSVGGRNNHVKCKEHFLKLKIKIPKYIFLIP